MGWRLDFRRLRVVGRAADGMQATLEGEPTEPLEPLGPVIKAINRKVSHKSLGDAMALGSPTV
jgi:hypothetical protein